MLSAIFAIDDSLGFGEKGGLPWPHIKEDMQHFVNKTKGKRLVMGRKTFKTLPIKANENRPFHVLSRLQHQVKSSHITFSSHLPKDGILIGGASLFNHTRFIESCDTVYVTRVKGTFMADTKIEQKTLDYLEAHYSKTMLAQYKSCTIWEYTK